MVVDGDGTVAVDTAKHERGRVTGLIRSQLDEQLGPHWRTTVAIAELPERDPGFGRSDCTWAWSRATVSLELVGDGSPLPEPEDDIRGAVARFLRPRVDHPDEHLRVAVTSTSDAARFAALARPGGPAPSSATAGQSATAQTYVTQPDDTLAGISAVFYGSTRYWRVIVAANPGLDPAALAPGRVITIPARPQP
jgi:hypothetical protein